MTSHPAWWQRGAIYEIYPRSFADSDGAGVGVLAGIAGRLDHLAALGAEAIWLFNFAAAPTALEASAGLAPRAALVLSTDSDRAGPGVELDGLVLAPGEGMLLRL